MMEFFKCPRCGNIITFLHWSGVTPICCGETMQKISENTVDAAHEKHVPFVTREGNKVHVQIGSVEHPMIDVHYIEWIIVEYQNGYQVKYLHPNEEPKADFTVPENCGELKVYEYCNIHGLWSVKA
jgi:superoxide reductase